MYILQEKQEFVSKVTKPLADETQNEATVDPAVMASFYRKFLNDNYSLHSQYNR